MQSLNAEYDLIWILDCLPEDEYRSFHITQDLIDFLAKNDIVDSEQSVCRNKGELFNAIDLIIARAESGSKICLHIVSHGDERGLWIKSTNDIVPWTTLTPLFEIINEKMNRTLLLNMTSCFGLHGVKIVNDKAESYPFFGLVGYSKELEVTRGKEIAERFYLKLSQGCPINIAIENIKAELKDDNLSCISSEGYKRIINP